MQNSKVDRYDWLIVAFIGALISYFPALFNPNFYFIDDVQNEFMPAFYNIGRTLREGELPILSLTNWFGGNYLVEYQYALYNPVSLLTYITLPSIESLATAATLLACFYESILAAGMLVLARSYGIKRPAAWLVAITIVCNNFISYWFAAAWPPLLIATAWMVWAWAFLPRAHESAGKWLLAVLFSYLMITAGSPHTNISFFLLYGLLILMAYKNEEKSKAIAMTLAGITALLLSAPTLIPIISVLDLTGRAHEIFNQSFLIPNLYDVLGISSPFLQGYMHIYFYPENSMVPKNGMMPIYTAFKRMGTPFLYCAWYILPLLPFIPWRKIDWKNTPLAILCILAAILLVGTQGPDHLSALMGPFRFIPYLHITMVLLFFVLLGQRKFIPLVNKPAILWSMGLLGFTALMELQKDPTEFMIIGLGLMITGAGLFFFLHAKSHGEALMYFMLSLTTIVLFILTHIYFPTNADLVDWHMSTHQGSKPLEHSTYDSYTFYDGGAGNPNSPDRLREFQTGYMPMEAGIAEINGYSSIIHRPLASMLCLTVFGETCPDVSSHLFQIDPMTGVPLADLFQIDRIVVMKGPHLDALRPYMTDGWKLESNGKYTQTFARTLWNINLPGMISWLSPGMDLTPIAKPRPLMEKYQINHRAHKNDHIVFARLWWPGYRAIYEGRQIPVHAERGIFVSVDIPDDAPDKGALRLSYWPPYFVLSMLLASLGALLCIGMACAFNLRSIMRIVSKGLGFSILKIKNAWAFGST